MNNKINSIIFKGRQGISWNDVELYLKKYYGDYYVVNEYGDKIYINSRFGSEFASSRYTKKLRGGLAKVKANIVQIIPELIQTATNRRWIENKDKKHKLDAKGGWYRYDVYFSVPVQAENEKEIRWNKYIATLVVRINENKLFLYDVINIKKEARTPADS